MENINFQKSFSDTELKELMESITQPCEEGDKIPDLHPLIRTLCTRYEKFMESPEHKNVVDSPKKIFILAYFQGMRDLLYVLNDKIPDLCEKFSYRKGNDYDK